MIPQGPSTRKLGWNCARDSAPSLLSSVPDARGLTHSTVAANPGEVVPEAPANSVSAGEARRLKPLRRFRVVQCSTLNSSLRQRHAQPDPSRSPASINRQDGPILQPVRRQSRLPLRQFPPLLPNTSIVAAGRSNVAGTAGYQLTGVDADLTSHSSLWVSWLPSSVAPAWP